MASRREIFNSWRKVMWHLVISRFIFRGIFFSYSLSLLYSWSFFRWIWRNGSSASHGAPRLPILCGLRTIGLSLYLGCSLFKPNDSVLPTSKRLWLLHRSIFASLHWSNLMVETEGEDMSDFRGKCTPLPEFQSGFWVSPKYEHRTGEHCWRIPDATLLHDMISDDPTGMSPFRVDFHHFAPSQGHKIHILAARLPQSIWRHFKAGGN